MFENAGTGNVAAVSTAARVSDAGLTRCYSLELNGGDPTSFAFGGVYPGTLHAHGQLHEWHRVSYSIGVAGEYLLHVRLHTSAASLRGSPYLLVCEPGPPFALSSKLPTEELEAEVGEDAFGVVMTTADSLGNQCRRGGGGVSCGCKDGCVTASCDDLGNGSYRLKWASSRTGTFSVYVKIDGRHVVGSPSHICFRSTVPVIVWPPRIEPCGCAPSDPYLIQYCVVLRVH